LSLLPNFFYFNPHYARVQPTLTEFPPPAASLALRGVFNHRPYTCR